MSPSRGTHGYVLQYHFCIYVLLIYFNRYVFVNFLPDMTKYLTRSYEREMKIIQSIIVVAKAWPLRALWWQERVQLVYHPLTLRKQKDRKPEGTVTLRLVPFYPRWSVPLPHFPKVLQLRLVEWAWLYSDTLSSARPHALTVPQISRLSPSEDQGFKHMNILGEQLTFKL